MIQIEHLSVAYQQTLALIRVDFPAPLGPRIPRMVGPWMVRERSSKASVCW